MDDLKANNGDDAVSHETESKRSKRLEQKERKKKEIIQYRYNLRKLKYEQKKIALEKENEYQREVAKIQNGKWFNFFTKWFFIGLFLILLSVVASVLWVPQSLLEESLSMIFSGLLSTVGIALLLGAVFDFSKNSEAFIQFVSKILKDIVMSKRFLSSLSDKDKEEALSLILKPTDKQIEHYSNINAFFKKRINESTNMFDINFRTNLVLNAEVTKQDGKVFCKTTLTQTMYKIQDTFKPLEIIFEKEGSELLEVQILPPQGDGCSIAGNQSQYERGGITYIKYSLIIPPEFEKYDHLTVKRTYLEPGYDHWMNFYWQSLSPYEGIVCSIDCRDDLTIKDYMIFDDQAYYDVKFANEKKRLEITSSQWLDTNTGFVVTISDADNLGEIKK